MHKHIFSAFDEALQHIRTQLVAMHGVTCAQMQGVGVLLGDAPGADLARTQEAFDAIKRGEVATNALEQEVLQACGDILVRFAPVAADLRLVMMAMELARLLEAIGDELQHVSKYWQAMRQQSLAVEGSATMQKQLQALATLCATALDKTGQVLADDDVEVAQRVMRDDAAINDLAAAVQQQGVVVAVATNPAGREEAVGWAIAVHLLCRACERMGDHCKSCCDRVVFVRSGARMPRE